MIIQIFSLLVLLFFTYYPTFIWMYDRWTAVDSYYSHGFLVPFVVAYLIFSKKAEIKNQVISSAPNGLVLFIAGIVIHLISRWLQVGFLSGFSLLPVFFGISLYLWGKSITRTISFPLAFSVFMIPFPLVIISNISLGLKLFAAQAAVWLVRNLGFKAIVQGSTIFMPHATLLVGDPCSGLRSLISLLALGALFAYFMKTTLIRKILLFLCSIPIAIISNILRITSMCAVAEIYGEDVALGSYHDISGVLLFIIAFILLLIMGRLLSAGRT